MNIRDLVGKIEEIERESTGKARDMCWDLINELIEIDLEMEGGDDILSNRSRLSVRSS